MEKAKVETGAASVALGLSLLGLIEAWGYAGEGGMMPRASMFLMVVLSAIWLVQSIIRIGRETGAVFTGTAEQFRGAALLAVASFALLAGMQYVGFFTTAFVLLPTVAYGLGYREPKVLAIGTMLFMLLLIVVFRVFLAVPLPDELLLSFMGD